MNVYQALIDGGIFAGVFILTILLIICYNPRLELRNYPPAVREQVRPLTPTEKREFRRITLFSLLLLLLLLNNLVLQHYGNMQVSLLTLVSHVFIMLMVLNFFDLLILDWLIFVTFTPRFIVIPGSEGNPAYKDYRYHTKGFVKGCVFSLIGAFLFGGITYGFLYLGILT